MTTDGIPGPGRTALWGVKRPNEQAVIPYADEQCSRRNCGPHEQVMHRRSPSHPWEPVAYHPVRIEPLDRVGLPARATSASERMTLVISRFADLEDDQTIAAVATDDGASHLTYGDLRAMLIGVLETEERLSRIANWHSRETGPAGMVGDLCTECGEPWPCDTRRMADGTYEDGDAPDTQTGGTGD